MPSGKGPSDPPARFQLVLPEASWSYTASLLRLYLFLSKNSFIHLSIEWSFTIARQCSNKHLHKSLYRYMLSFRITPRGGMTRLYGRCGSLLNFLINRQTVFYSGRTTPFFHEQYGRRSGHRRECNKLCLTFKSHIKLQWEIWICFQVLKLHEWIYALHITWLHFFIQHYVLKI